MKIGICADHAGFEYKTKFISYLLGKGYEVVNFGTDSAESMDYPDVAHPLAEAVSKGEVDLGIAMCGTGNGMILCLNRHKGVRACIAWGTALGKIVKEHNNANILVLPARFISYQMAISIFKAWIGAEFKGGRHQRRLEKVEPK